MINKWISQAKPIIFFFEIFGQHNSPVLFNLAEFLPYTPSEGTRLAASITIAKQGLPS